MLSGAGERETEGVSVDLGEIAGEAAERWGAQAAERGIELEHSAESPAGMPGRGGRISSGRSTR